MNCLSHKNTEDGFVLATSDPVVLVNCVSSKNGEAGIDVNIPGSNLFVLAINCNLNPDDEPNTLGKVTSDITLQEIDGFTGDIKLPFASSPRFMSITPEVGSSLFESSLGFHPDFSLLQDFSTVGPIENQDTILAGLQQGIISYYAGLHPVTKMEDLI